MLAQQRDDFGAAQIVDPDVDVDVRHGRAGHG
jgi:hypothetical protein